jgi:hypothetical protein
MAAAIVAACSMSCALKRTFTDNRVIRSRELFQRALSKLSPLLTIAIMHRQSRGSWSSDRRFRLVEIPEPVRRTFCTPRPHPRNHRLSSPLALPNETDELTRGNDARDDASGEALARLLAKAGPIGTRKQFTYRTRTIPGAKQSIGRCPERVPCEEEVLGGLRQGHGPCGSSSASTERPRKTIGQPRGAHHIPLSQR